jgi:hypothetical protein
VANAATLLNRLAVISSAALPDAGYGACERRAFAGQSRGRRRDPARRRDEGAGLPVPIAPFDGEHRRLVAAVHLFLISGALMAQTMPASRRVPVDYTCRHDLFSPLTT